MNFLWFVIWWVPLLILGCGEESELEDSEEEIVCPYIDFVEADKTTVAPGEEIALVCHVVDADAETSVRWKWKKSAESELKLGVSFSNTEGTQTVFTPYETGTHKFYCIVSKPGCTDERDPEGNSVASSQSIEVEVEAGVCELTINVFDALTFEPLRAVVSSHYSVLPTGEDSSNYGVEWTGEDGSVTSSFASGGELRIFAMSACYKTPLDEVSATVATETGKMSVDVPLDRLDVALESLETDIPFTFLEYITYKVKVTGLDEIEVKIKFTFAALGDTEGEVYSMRDDGEGGDEVAGDNIWAISVIAHGSAIPEIGIAIAPSYGVLWGEDVGSDYWFTLMPSETETFYDLTDDWESYKANYCGNLPH